MSIKFHSNNRKSADRCNLPQNGLAFGSMQPDSMSAIEEQINGEYIAKYLQWQL